MKRFLMTTALVIGTTGAAVAADMDAQQLRNQVDNYFETTTMDVDVATMTGAQVSEVYLAISSNDSASDRDAAVRAVLNDWNVVYDNAEGADVATPNNQLRVEVGNYLDSEGIDIDVSALSDAQVAEIYLAMTSEDESGRSAAVNDIVAGRTMMPDEPTMERDQLIVTLENALEGTQYEGQVEMLSDAELAEAYLAITSANSASAQNQALRSVFN